MPVAYVVKVLIEIKYDNFISTFFSSNFLLLWHCWPNIKYWDSQLSCILRLGFNFSKIRKLYLSWIVSQYFRTTGKSFLRASVHQQASSIRSKIGTYKKYCVSSIFSILDMFGAWKSIILSIVCLKHSSRPCWCQPKYIVLHRGRALRSTPSPDMAKSPFSQTLFYVIRTLDISSKWW